MNLESDGNGNEVVDETIKNSKVHVIVTDSYGASLRVNMRTQTYKKDTYWIVGCMGGEYMVTASFTEINQFLDSPPEDGVFFYSPPAVFKLQRTFLLSDHSVPI